METQTNQPLDDLLTQSEGISAKMKAILVRNGLDLPNYYKLPEAELDLWYTFYKEQSAILNQVIAIELDKSIADFLPDE